MFKIGDRVKRIGSTDRKKGMITGKVYTVKETGFLILPTIIVEEIPRSNWNCSLFILANEQLEFDF